jgi:hypothetical protein
MEGTFPGVTLKVSFLAEPPEEAQKPLKGVSVRNHEERAGKDSLLYGDKDGLQRTHKNS